MHFRSYDVIRGHEQIFSNDIRLEWAMGFKPAARRLYRSDKLIEMQYDFSTQVMTLTWGQISILTFLGQIIHYSMLFDEKRRWCNNCSNTTESYVIAKNDFGPIQPFCFFLGPWRLNDSSEGWGQISRHIAWIEQAMFAFWRHYSSFRSQATASWIKISKWCKIGKTRPSVYEHSYQSLRVLNRSLKYYIAGTQVWMF